MKNMSLRRVGIRSLVWQLDLLWRDGGGDQVPEDIVEGLAWSPEYFQTPCLALPSVHISRAQSLHDGLLSFN